MRKAVLGIRCFLRFGGFGFQGWVRREGSWLSSSPVSKAWVRMLSCCWVEGVDFGEQQGSGFGAFPRVWVQGSMGAVIELCRASGLVL